MSRKQNTPPRDYMLSLKFTKKDVETWKSAAKAKGENLTGFLERAVNAYVTTQSSAKPAECSTSTTDPDDDEWFNEWLTEDSK